MDVNKLLLSYMYLTQCFRMGPDLCHVFHVWSIFMFGNFNYIMFVVAYFSLLHWVSSQYFHVLQHYRSCGV